MPSTGLGLGYLSWKERGLRGTKAGTVERAACPIHVPGEDAPAQIQNQDLAEISRSSKGAPDASKARLRYPMPSLTVM
jgi:hypothetical protein